MSNKSDTSTTLLKWHNFRIKIIFQGVLVGVFAGLLIVFYRYLVEKAFHVTTEGYAFLRENTQYIPIGIAILVILGIIVGYLVEKEPMISGSGIPQVEGVLLRKLDMNWARVITYKFFGGLIALAAGLSVGREGPSIQMGAAVGEGFTKLTKRPKIKEKYLITAGASAGLAAAFNAPLAGVMFSLEEVHKNFSPIVLTTSLAASITSDFVSKHFFGLKPIFDFNITHSIPLKDYPYLLVLGIIIGFGGVLFNKGILTAQNLYGKQKVLSKKYWPIIPFILAGILGVYIPEVLGGGHELIVSLTHSTPIPLISLVVVIIVKYLFTIISYGSAAPGGIFLPLLVIGALIGAIYGIILSNYFGFSNTYIVNFIIIAMAGYFTAVVKAPITGMVLLTEMTGSFSHLLSIAFVCIIAYVITDLLNSEPIYESLFERVLSKSDNIFKGESNNKVIIEVPVCVESFLEDKKICQVDWPCSCLIAALKRGEKEIIPRGDTVIYAGDYLIVLANEDTASSIQECLTSFGSN
ncbi:ClC family H(+)/Cl(-) exchange transporter [Clostridium sediminicola]|uniref:ClC family H(+)/Cl(-) exchange transporter n=1 Tax=Clostridium sediminicola TaxID=3114879 RepID=UPI0031F239ED